MYSKYTTLASVSITDVLQDIVDILTGETNIANLSAATDIQNTSIFTTYKTAGWSLWDAVSATQIILRSPCIDDPSQYKYLGLQTSLVSGTTYNIRPTLYEQWNNVTHTSSGNIVQGNATTCFQVNTANATTFVIYADVTLALLSTSTHIFYVSEIDRKNDSWLSVGTGFLPVVLYCLPVSGSVYRAYFPKFLTASSGALQQGATTSSGSVFPSIVCGSGVSNPVRTYATTTTATYNILMLDLFYFPYASSPYPETVSAGAMELKAIMIPNAFAGFLDEISGAKDYVILDPTPGASSIFKNYAMFAVPKG